VERILQRGVDFCIGRKYQTSAAQHVNAIERNSLTKHGRCGDQDVTGCFGSAHKGDEFGQEKEDKVARQ